MGRSDGSADRRTRAFWHRFPEDDAWRQCTLASSVKNGFCYQPCCRNCWRSGEIMTPAEVSAWAEVPMETPIIALAARLVCSTCGYPAGYFHLHNPQVKARC
jgi:hypothetical protein